MRPESPSGAYEAIMVPFLPPTPAPGFAGTGQFPSGRQQPVPALPGFATLLGSAAPILPVGTPEALPDAQPVSPRLAAALLVAANEDATPPIDPAPLTVAVEPEAPAPTVSAPVPAPPPGEAAVAAATPDVAPPSAAPVQRGAPKPPVVDAAPASPAPVTQDTGVISPEPVTPDRATATVETAEETADEPTAEPRASDAESDLDTALALRDPLVPAPVSSPESARPAPLDAGPTDAPVSDVPARPVHPTPADKASPQQPPVDTEMDMPARPAQSAPNGKTPPQQPPIDTEMDAPGRPYTVAPKAVPIATAPARPDAQPFEIAPGAGHALRFTDAQSIEPAPAAAPSVEPVFTVDEKAVAVEREAAPPGDPVATPARTALPDQAVIDAPPVPDDAMTASIPRDLPSAPALREGGPPVATAAAAATAAPQDVAALGDTPGHPESAALRVADPQPVQRAPVESAGSTTADSGESGRQAAVTTAVAPAPVAAAQSAPVAFDQLVAEIDATAPDQSAEPRARAAAIGEDVAVAIVRHAESGADDTLIIRLDPGDLGRIEVRLKVEEGQRLSAELTADQPATLDLLRRDSDSLSRALNDAGFRTEGQSLRFDGRGTGQGGEQGFGQQERRTVHRAYLGEDDPAPQSASAYSPQVRSAGRIDLFA